MELNVRRALLGFFLAFCLCRTVECASLHRRVRSDVPGQDAALSTTNGTAETVGTKTAAGPTSTSAPGKETGRSLNIDIEKYISPEFHNKNNVYILPTSPEIQKYVDPVREDYEDRHVTEPALTSSKPTSGLPLGDFLDTKFRLVAESIKQNLEDIQLLKHGEEEGEEEEDGDGKEPDDVPTLIEKAKNHDNDTVVSLKVVETKNVEKSEEQDGGKSRSDTDVEIGKNVDYKSTFLKTKTYEEKYDNKNPNNISTSKDEEKPTEQTVESTVKKVTNKEKIPSTTESMTDNTSTKSTKKPLPTDSPKTKTSRQMSTVETPTSSSKPEVTKRGSTKYADSIAKNTTPITVKTTRTIDIDDKGFSLPPSATAWSLASMKNTPESKPKEQVVQENSIVKITVEPPGPSPSSNPNPDILTTDPPPNTDIITTESPPKTTPTVFSQTNSTQKFERSTTEKTQKVDTKNENEIYKTSEEITDASSLAPSTKNESVVEVKSTTMTYSTVIERTNVSRTTPMTETTEETTETTTVELSTVPVTVTEVRTTFSTSEKVATDQAKDNEVLTTTQLLDDVSEASSTVGIEEVVEDGDFEEIDLLPEKGPKAPEVVTKIPIISTTEATTANEAETTTDVTEKTTPMLVTEPPSVVHPTGKSISVKNSPSEVLTTVPAMTTPADNGSTTADPGNGMEMLSNDDESNPGMVAAIAISSVGAVCLVLLAGLLIIMRKRQKRVTYGQRCRPVSLDAYSLDNVSVYNSVRRGKAGMRASKRSYGNPAFDDPVSVSHQMNFQALAKFNENLEGIGAEFEEIPQVTARANELPVGCETKNRYANVIPLPETRVFLNGSDNDPLSDYINANYVTGPKNTRGYYIACQAPMENTIDDFWRMVWEQQSRVVLMLTNLYENGAEKCADYLPPSEVLDCHRLFGDFQITLKKRDVKEKYVISSLQLKNMVSNSWREVTHLWYMGWPERGVPTEANSLIAFLIEARSHLKAASNNNTSRDENVPDGKGNNANFAPATGGPEGGPVVVHCSPGTGRTGTVIACDVAIRDFELTRNVDIPKIVYRVRRDRASAVQTRDQYAFIYKLITLYATKLTGGGLDSI